ncbi:AAA family ATPase [Nostoc sp. CENA67]|uniref:histidine kinase n=1 Tax=Amazonocrinis nigriterrae CENA67 TaxID=2794033 RepID=A0A8J7HWD4_9NOST|nr:ATP-binding sensor histidine kinase [Amazonocrinis nigriterrae]MBH8564497.1 AAA family ATPase [Amazonocrinis nigriterrae CENA67]
MLSTLKIPGYDISEVIHEGVNTIVYRGESQPEQEKVILKVLKAEYPTLEQITRLKHEYSITENLHLNGVVKVLRQEVHQNRLVLVAQDIGGISLKTMLEKQDSILPLQTFLNIAIQISRSLISLHTHHIIHKDIKPSNIIINPQTFEVKLTDFSIASRLSKETPFLANFNQLEGTLAYMSPEQTGRMNRIVDYRTDFYSLGVTFYEMLTCRLPYEGSEPIEIVHCHIAKEPTSIQKFNPEVPAPVAAIVSKLMAKNAEERYQSAAGLLADLQFCLTQLENTGEIIQFIPGQKDRVAQLLIPQKLYGREQEVSSLLAAFDRISHGESELMLVSGYSGIGKSSLVNEVHKPVVRQRGYFISGKFDQMGRSVPYASIIQAFQFLMRQLLTENTQQLQKWKQKLQAALGANGQVIIDVIPEVELIIGRQPEVAQLGATEAQNRFNRVFQRFIQVFCQKEHPLVLFLDDLQWADSASLNLLQVLMTNVENKYLLLIGAYRDNEVSAGHPLIQTLDGIKNTGTTINNIILRPLSIIHVQQILLDTFVETDNFAALQELANLLFNKTQGNPFFFTQLLKTLHQENLLKFDFITGEWQWNIQDIQSTTTVDKSVVELIAENIQKLPDATQMVLILSACVGARFSLDVLAIVSEQSLLMTAEALQPALQQGLILPLNNNYKVPLLFAVQELKALGFDDSKVMYRFLHDRVQQACYSLIVDQDKKKTHLKIGKLLLKNTPTTEIESNIFDIVNQLNMGIDTFTQQREKDELAKLNLKAGRKAKAAAAYEGAFKYFNIGLELLSSQSWQIQYDLTLALYESATEAAYLTTNFAMMEQWTDIVLQQAKTIVDKVKVYEVKIQTRIAQGKLIEAIKVGLKVLELLDIKLSETATFEDVPQALQETANYLHGKNISDFIKLPIMTDVSKLAAMRILSCITAPTFLAAPPLFSLTIFAQVKLSIQYGNSPFSPFAYASYGLILHAIVGDIEAGYEFGKLALSLVEQLNAYEMKARTFFSATVFIKHVKEHIVQTLPLLREAFSSGLENGDLEYAGWSAMYQYQYSFFIGQELGTLEREMSVFSNTFSEFKQAVVLSYHENCLQVVLNLQGKAKDPCRLVGVYDEETMLPLLLEANEVVGLCFFYIYKLLLCFLFRKYTEAVVNAEQLSKYLDGGRGSIFVPLFYFYDSLARLAVYFDTDITQRQEILDKVQANQEKLHISAQYAPMNYQHKYDLVEAEKYRILGHKYQAMDYYDRAIAGAAKNSYIQEEALANECAALFYSGLGKQKIAKGYMTEAYYSYIKWGAIAKVKHLEKTYPELTIRTPAAEIEIDANSSIFTNTISPTISTTKGTIANNSNILDLATVIKASSAISNNIILESLPRTLLHVVLENAGAQKGGLILEKDNQLFIEAIDTNEQEMDIVQQSIPIEESQYIPIKLINYVARTHQALVIGNATIDPISKNDFYINQYQCKSILCVPLIYQRSFIGIFYLENNLITDAFTPARLELITILASQAAIAIKNARLYAWEQEKSQELQQALSKLQQTQAQLVHTEKISSLGQLVAGVAHEVNNPVGFINGNLSHASQYIEDLINHLQLYIKHYPDPVPEIVEDAENIDLEYLLSDLPKMISSMKLGTIRIKDIMQSLRNFSRVDGNNKKAVDICEGIDTTLMILSHRLKAKAERPEIKVVKQYEKLPLIECYPGQLNQVFMNLLSNAIDALEESNVGKTYSEVEKNPNIITIHTFATDQQVTISIADNGLGMSEEVRQRLFNAFFTTKAEGKGTGLGLSISYQIITEAHGGTLKCLSSKGEGAEFVIKIPI